MSQARMEERIAEISRRSSQNREALEWLANKSYNQGYNEGYDDGEAARPKRRRRKLRSVNA